MEGHTVVFDYQFLEDFGKPDDQGLVYPPQALLCMWYTGILNVKDIHEIWENYT